MDIAEPPARRDYIGLRVARWRVIAGMTQQQLADLVGVGEPYISLIENGKRPVTKRSLLHKLADALQVSVADITGQPAPPVTPAQHGAYVMVPAIRRVLDGTDEEIRPRPGRQLAALADFSTTLWMTGGDWAPYCHLIPDMLAETQVLADSGQHLVAAVKTFTVASWMVHTLGFHDLGRLLLRQAEVYARQAGEPGHEAATAWFLARETLEGGNQQRALQLAEKALRRFADVYREPDVPGWLVMLHLQAAFAAGSLGRTDDVGMHTAEAAGLAPRVVGDPWHMEPGPANVGVWRVGMALENGDPEVAPDLARDVDRSVLSIGRLARLAFDTGRGWYMRGDTNRCIQHILEADRLYPLGLWTQPPIVELVGQMARDSRVHGGSGDLRTLCLKVGIDPLAPPGPES